MNSSNIYSDKELLLQVAEGDETAFKILYLRFLPRLRPYLLQMVKNESIANDIIQDAFIRIWLNRTKLPDIEYPSTWIFKVAANECYRTLRTMASEPVFMELEGASIKGNEYTGLQEVQYKQTRQYIQEAINLLSPRRRQIYEMSRLEGKKPAEIASELNLTVSTVKNTLVTTMESVREYLSKHGITLSTSMILFLLEKKL